MAAQEKSDPRAVPGEVALFVTCLVDLFRPEVGFAAIRLLENAGCRVVVPMQQTCCGQPAYNSGDRRDAAAIARQVVDVFEDFPAVVVPSGSCAGMIRHHYPALLADDPAYADRARRLADRTHELTAYLVDRLGVEAVDAACDRTATYHDSCSALREMKVADQPRKLLRSVRGLTISELADTAECCGFGGTFCVKYPDISDRMVSDKVRAAQAAGADLLLSGDLGCLLNIAGKAARMQVGLEVRHVAEVLSGMTDTPAIGARQEEGSA